MLSDNLEQTHEGDDAQDPLGHDIPSVGGWRINFDPIERDARVDGRQHRPPVSNDAHEADQKIVLVKLYAICVSTLRRT